MRISKNANQRFPIVDCLVFKAPTGTTFTSCYKRTDCWPQIEDASVSNLAGINALKQRVLLGVLLSFSLLQFAHSPTELGKLISLILCSQQSCSPTSTNYNKLVIL